MGEFETVFISAVRAGGSERESALSYFETKFASSFKGESGVQFFIDFMNLVETADASIVPIVRERFMPLVDEDLLSKHLFKAAIDEFPQHVKRREQEVQDKEVLATFLEAIDRATPETIGHLVESTIQNCTPVQLKEIIVFLALAVTNKTK